MSEGLYWAVCIATALVVDALPTDAILLVVNY